MYYNIIYNLYIYNYFYFNNKQKLIINYKIFKERNYVEQK